MASVCKEWPGEVIIVNGRPRNPKCQGLVEQGNGTVEKMVGVCLDEADPDLPPWSEWLPVVQCEYNVNVSSYVLCIYLVYVLLSMSLPI